MENIIKTISGKRAHKDNCRLIDGEYYLIGNINIENSGDVYLINDRYIRFNTGRIVFNHTTKAYCLKNNSLIEGAIGFDKDTPILGYFQLNPLYNVIIHLKNNTHIICINSNIIPLDYREEISTGEWFHISLKQAKSLNSIRNVEKSYKESLPYDSKDKMIAQIMRYNSSNPIITKSVKDYSPILKDYTYGLEFETINGIIPNSKINNLPLLPLRDGSINGLEYVTIPLSKDKGLQSVINCTYELDKRTIYDESCSLHLHIGNVQRTPEYILAFYKVISYFQDEIFSLFPLYKKYNFGVKRKNYSKPFPFNKINSQLEPNIDIENKEQIIKNFTILFNHLSGGVDFINYKNDLENVKEHPKDPGSNQKWNITTRYYAVNFIPLIFGNKETIEFRIHTPTYDIHKIINFLFLNVYLIDFANMYTKEILENPKFLINIGNIENFISNYIFNSKAIKNNIKNKLIDYQLMYFNNRARMIESFNQKGDIIGKEDKIKVNKILNWKILDDIEIEIQDFDDYYRKYTNINSESSINTFEKKLSESHKNLFYGSIISKTKKSKRVNRMSFNSGHSDEIKNFLDKNKLSFEDNIINETVKSTEPIADFNIPIYYDINIQK